MGHHNPDSPSHLKHYFHDVNQQYETSKFAMWAFILTEVLTFAGLFVAYIVYRSWYPDMFVDAHKLLDVSILQFEHLWILSMASDRAFANILAPSLFLSSKYNAIL